MRKRDEFSVEELFTKKGTIYENCIGVFFLSEYSMRYEQDCNEFYRFPELADLLREGVTIQYAEGWNTLQISGKWEDKGIARKLHDAFSGCSRMAVWYYCGHWEVTSNQHYRQEDFEHFRNRTLFELRDHLGLPHKGRGKDSIRLPLCVK